MSPSSTIRDLLQRPEGRTLDFKRQEVSLPKALKALVAFANTAGGTLVIGADDDGTPLGVEDIKIQEERYANAITSGIEPPLTPDLQPISHEGVDLLLVRVPRFPGPFYVRKDGPDDGVYIRVGSTNRRATQEQREELRRLAQARAFDERPCLGAGVADLDLDAIDRVFSVVGRVPDGSALESLGVVAEAGGEKLPTNAGVILFGTAAARRRFFPDATFRCARFLGTEKVHFLDQLDLDASILDALDEVERFVRRNTRTAARIEALRRENVPEYSTIQLREVIANAAAHADYSLRGMTLKVAIYDDRLEVENPGGWPIGFSEEDFKAGISRPRNPAIARVLRELSVIEQWGSGYRRIQEASERGGYPLPIWKEVGLVLRSTLFPVTVPSVVSPDTWGVTVTRADLNDRQRWMLLQLALDQPVAAADIASEFDVSVRTARRDLARLQEVGFVAFEGAPKTGRYVLLRDADALHP